MVPQVVPLEESTEGTRLAERVGPAVRQVQVLRAGAEGDVESHGREFLFCVIPRRASKKTQMSDAAARLVAQGLGERGARIHLPPAERATARRTEDL